MFAAEVDRNTPPFIIFEHGDELETGPQDFEVLAQSRHSDVFGMLKFGDRPLGNIQTAGEFCVAHSIGVANLVELDLLQGLGPLPGEPILSAGPRSWASAAASPPQCHAGLGRLVTIIRTWPPA